MTNLRFRPIDQLTTDWEAVSTGPESRRAAALLGAAEPAVRALDPPDLGALVSALRRPGGATGRVDAARVVQAMLRSQSVHPLVPRAVLQAVVPGLVGVARRLGWGSGGDWDDGGTFFADLVATTWEIVVAWSGQDRDYAVLDLLSAVRCRLRRQLVQQRSARDHVDLGLDADDPVLGRAAYGTTDLDLLANTIDDLAGRGLDRSDAAVLYGTRVLGLSICELAQLTGRSRRHLAQRRERAERELCA